MAVARFASGRVWPGCGPRLARNMMMRVHPAKISVPLSHSIMNKKDERMRSPSPAKASEMVHATEREATKKLSNPPGRWRGHGAPWLAQPNEGETQQRLESSSSHVTSTITRWGICSRTKRSLWPISDRGRESEGERATKWTETCRWSGTTLKDAVPLWSIPL